ncbi:MAG: hypothetical protein XU11_C0004G0067 [Candidatus Dadabacteria bacterium CSP1-2]|nr:MAG: hypothetical protein XU11_C0004G0067 [Candidatus Dadabacteria bacterium CSP1-2]
MKQKEKKDVLIALINNKEDFRIAHEERWYRIPVQSAPLIVRDKKLKYIAFYQTKIFGENAFKIEWYGKVKNISVVKRKVLFPNLMDDPKAENEYYKIEFNKLIKLPSPIISRRHRRVLSITTTFKRFESAKELNDVFKESAIEEKLWEEMKSKGINAERQYMIVKDENMFYLDFAILTKERNIDVECDSDKYHTMIRDVKRDKQRNNILESLGWAVLRYTADDIENNLGKCILLVKETVSRYGGLQDASDKSKYRDLDEDNGNQLLLFD